jgi:hypothetical protein
MSYLLNMRRRNGGNPFADYILEGNAPSLVMDTEAGLYGLDGASKAIADVVTLTRASTATYVNSSGVLASAAVDEIRVDHDGSGNVLGMLVEPAATNLLLNTATLSTQNVTVTAVEHTLHFTGTGTITLSGASTAGPLVGTGTGESNRVSLTFTPNAGTLICIVTGSVTVAQLEVGPQSSYYPSTGTQGTRAKDVPLTLLSAFDFNTTVGTVLIEYESPKINSQHFVNISDGTANNRIYYQRSGGGQDQHRSFVKDGGVGTADVVGLAAETVGGNFRGAFSWETTVSFGLSVDGAAVVEDTGVGVTIPTGLTSLDYGMSYLQNSQLGGHIKKLIYYHARLSNSALETWSGA